MKAYLIGVCGTAMSHIAILLKQMGYDVCGSDSSYFDPIASLLKNNDIKTYENYSADRLKKLSPDIVIVGNVVSRGNEEVEYLLTEKSKIHFCSFPEFIEKNIAKNRSMYVVTGTHGKTTTTSVLTYLLKQVCDPGYLIGGIPKNFTSGTSIGNNSDPFVIEGDEYDTAFFDKRSKFFHYWPNTLIINNIEFDHGDIFSNVKDIQRSFYQLTRQVPQNGHILLNGDDRNTMELLPCGWTNVHTVGFGDKNDWRIVDFSDNEEISSFNIVNDNKIIFLDVKSILHGEFNAQNLAMAIVACAVNGYEVKIPNLLSFNGVKRRQNVIYKKDNLIVIEDFAHHPTAIKNMLKMVKNIYQDYLIIACFEPACNTSASKFFEKNICETFVNADEVWFAPIRQSIYCDKFIDKLEKLDLNAVSVKFSSKCKNIFSDWPTFYEYLSKFSVSKPTVLCCFSNGKLSNKLAEKFKS